MFAINVLGDYSLNENERLAISDGLSEIHKLFQDNYMSSDFKIRFYKRGQLFINGKNYSVDAVIAAATSYPGDLDKRGIRERLYDVEDVVRQLRKQNPFLNEAGFILLVTGRTMVNAKQNGGFERVTTFLDDNVYILSTSTYREEQLIQNDEYRVVKLEVQRGVGVSLGVFKHRRQKVFWYNGKFACASELCVMNRADTTIQKMGLARRTDRVHAVYCSYCLYNIKRFHYLPNDLAQS